MLVTNVRRPIDDVWIGLSLLAAACAAIASAGGILLPSAYARETSLWAAQGEGQDVVNLVVVLPLLLACTWGARRGSMRPALVWFGLLLYLTYSYVLYAFFVHFNGLFLVYVGALGASVYALAGAAAGVDARAWRDRFASARGERALGVLFMASAMLFGALWLSEIVPALAAGALPPSAIDAGLIVNPVHVLDLAFVVPAMAVNAVLLWKRRPLGFLAAVPLATFMAAMGVAIIGMAVMESIRGLASAGVAVPMSVLVALTVWFTARVVSSAARAA
jgi:hypothetical protein